MFARKGSKQAGKLGKKEGDTFGVKGTSSERVFVEGAASVCRTTNN